MCGQVLYLTADALLLTLEMLAHVLGGPSSRSPPG